jgi:hypothetical protein
VSKLPPTIQTVIHAASSLGRYLIIFGRGPYRRGYYHGRALMSPVDADAAWTLPVAWCGAADPVDVRPQLEQLDKMVPVFGAAPSPVAALGLIEGVRHARMSAWSI